VVNSDSLGNLQVWSAPNYCYRCGNVASILSFNENMVSHLKPFVLSKSISAILIPVTSFEFVVSWCFSFPLIDCIKYCLFYNDSIVMRWLPRGFIRWSLLNFQWSYDVISSFIYLAWNLQFSIAKFAVM